MSYYLGLDMGTNSVGWAVTDKEYNLLRRKGKDLWGIREFEEANTAVERRGNRESRRRHQRELARIGLVKSYFDEAVQAEDPLFFVRLDNSKYFMEDKAEELHNQNCIFDDADYKDSDYHKDYPTIFHLRDKLIKNEVPVDNKYVRLVYLAISNMFKHRGHFLDASISSDSEKLPEISTVYGRLCENIGNLETEEIHVNINNSPDYVKIKDILSNKKISRTVKKEQLMEVLDVDKKDKSAMEIVKAICGLKFDAKKLFPLEDVEEKIDMEFSSASYEDNCETYHQLIGDDFYEIVEDLKAIYDIGVLAGILGDYSYLSEARIASYNEHKDDLKLLKDVMKRYNSAEEYDEMFRMKKDGTYSAYVKSFNCDGKDRRSSKGRKKQDLYTTIKKYAKTWDLSDKDVTAILEKIDTETFLPKQLNSENGVIPNQVHTKELKKILGNAEEHLSFLKEKDESGLTVSERIIKLFSFHIPYYIGPVTTRSEENKGNGWVVRKEKGRVLPWNYEEKIDVAATSERFIMRMVRKCSYISGESALPKESLIYQKFSVLNEINNIKINDQRIDVELKQAIYNDLFKKGKKVTKKELCKYLVKKRLISEESEISGIDREINNYLGSYGKLLPIFGEDLEKDSYMKMAEEIIRLSTIFGDSKKFLKNKLEEQYGDIISKENMKRILGLKFRDWGRLSREFLELEGNDENGEITSLINVLWTTKYNLMEIINSDEFMFKQSLSDKQNTKMKLLEEFTSEDLDDYYFSAPVKRMVWQTFGIIKELKEVIGEYPERVFIEMTRHDEEKKGDAGRKDSRTKMFTELYKKVKDETHDWSKIIENADKSGTIRSKKMYAYLTQMGKCMYCGKNIDLDELFTTDYDLDHIYPRSQVKDDNLANNLVLVHKRHNANKSDTYPIDASIRNNAEVSKLWSFLRAKNLINEEKYKRLTACNSFTDEQRADFIARQMVETSQGTKGVADILKQALPEGTQIVYAKAKNVSDFRKDNDMLKSRIVNDFHHANDAYLNIVVGNVYFTKFTQNPLNFIKKEFDRDSKSNHYNLGKMFKFDVVRGGECAWVAPKKNEDGKIIDFGTMDTVRKVMSKNTPLMTRMNFEATGGFANETLYSADAAKEDVYIPFKETDDRLKDVTKYGGYTSVSTAYFFLVEHEVKDKRIRTIECVPIYLAEKIKNNSDALLEYCVNTLKLVNPSVRLPKIKIQSLIKKDGFYMYISGKTGNRYIVKNAVNMKIGREWINYVKKLENNDEKSSDITTDKNIELYDILTDKFSTGIFSKRPNPIGDKLSDSRNFFINLSVSEQKTVILEIFKLCVIGNPSADLQLIKLSSKTGVSLIPQKLTETKEMLLINQSITGIYESVIDLLTV